jgi:hypothetical protein
MMDLHPDGGWSFEYEIAAAERDRCVVVSRIRAGIWQYGDGREIASRRKLTVPMPSLTGEWQLGPEGLVRGC